MLSRTDRMLSVSVAAMGIGLLLMLALVALWLAYGRILDT